VEVVEKGLLKGLKTNVRAATADVEVAEKGL
jgi:hypothetical protein